MVRSITWTLLLIGGVLLLPAPAGAQTATFPPLTSSPAPPPAAPSQVPPALPPQPSASNPTYSSPTYPAQPVQPLYAPRAAPAPASSHSASPADHGYHLETNRNKGLLWAGSLTLGVGYLGVLGYSASADVGQGGGWLWLPVLGPWAALSARDFGCKKSQQLSQDEINNCLSAALRELKTDTVLTFSGLIQVVGATLLVVGIMDTEQQWLPNGLEVQAGPVGASGQGLLARGTF